jgi:hypothetical protein
MVMDVESALYFLGGSIFIGLGICVIGMFLLLMNNIYHNIGSLMQPQSQSQLIKQTSPSYKLDMVY